MQSHRRLRAPRGAARTAAISVFAGVPRASGASEERDEFLPATPGQGRPAAARSSWYQVPGLPPRSAGAAGQTGTNPALASTFCDATFACEVAALSVRN